MSVCELQMKVNQIWDTQPHLFRLVADVTRELEKRRAGVEASSESEDKALRETQMRVNNYILGVPMDPEFFPTLAENYLKRSTKGEELEKNLSLLQGGTEEDKEESDPRRPAGDDVKMMMSEADEEEDDDELKDKKKRHAAAAAHVSESEPPAEEEKQKKARLDDDDDDDDDEGADLMAHYDDMFFGEDDSDIGDEDDHFRSGVAESVYDERFAPLDEDEKDDGIRRCLETNVCNKDQHIPDFRGKAVFELYKVILKFNDKCDPIVNGQLCGEVARLDPSHCGLDESPRDLRNPVPVSYYSVRHDKPHAINLNSHEKYALLPLSFHGPRPPIRGIFNYMSFNFALRIDGKDVFNSSNSVQHINPSLFGPGPPPKAAQFTHPPQRLNTEFPNIKRVVLGDPDRDRVLVCAKYAVFIGAWARVEVIMLDKDVTGFYGAIMARSCIFFYARMRLLTIRRDSNKRRLNTQTADKGEVGANSKINLTRSVVAVPKQSSLIIGGLELIYIMKRTTNLFAEAEFVFLPKERESKPTSFAVMVSEAFK